MKIGFL